MANIDSLPSQSLLRSLTHNMGYTVRNDITWCNRCGNWTSFNCVHCGCLLCYCNKYSCNHINTTDGKLCNTTSCKNCFYTNGGSNCSGCLYKYVCGDDSKHSSECYHCRKPICADCSNHCSSCTNIACSNHLVESVHGSYCESVCSECLDD